MSPLNLLCPGPDVKEYAPPLSFCSPLKGIVQQKLRWVMSSICRQLLLFCLGAYILFLNKGKPFFKVDKTGFSIL
jgi:hypothetical protein